MKRFLSVLLCVAMVLTSTVFAVGADSSNPCMSLSDTTGASGYSQVTDSLSTKIVSEGGVTFIADVYVKSFTSPDGGRFSQIAAFTGGSETVKYNLLSYDFTNQTFKAGQSSEWICNDQSTAYSEIASNPFAWETGKWYELAMRFNGDKAAIYLNGICVISTEFDAADIDYLVLYPQYCDIRLDNIRICAKDYDVVNGTGTVWATEDFNGLSAVNDSAVWNGDSYTISASGCDGVITTLDDNCVFISDADGFSGYSAAQDAYNAKVAEEGGVTLIADVYVESYTDPTDGYASQIVAFTGAYGTDTKYNYVGYDFGAGAFTAKESSAWISSSQTDMSSGIASADYTLGTGAWYEIAWQFDGNSAAIYLDGVEMLTAEFSAVNNSYIVLNPQFCDVRIDNIRLCDKDYDVANGVGTVWAVEDYSNAVSFDASDVWYVDMGYKLNTKGVDHIELGDVNDSGKFDNADLSLVSRYLKGANVNVSRCTDVDLSGKIDNKDLVLMRRILKGAAYSPDITVDVVPVENDNSMIVEDENEGGSGEITPPVTETPETTAPETVAPETTAPETTVPETEAPVTTTVTTTTAPVTTPEETTTVTEATTEVTTATPYDPDAPVDSGSGDTSELDDCVLKFDAMDVASYSLLFSDLPQSYSDMALTFDVYIDEVDSSAKFAGLGVWNGNSTTGYNSFVGYDFNDKQFASGDCGYPSVPDDNNGPKLNLAIGEWNHFCLRRLNNDTFQIYVNGTLYYQVTEQSFNPTYFLFGFKNVVAYVDNYQYYHAGTACGLVTDFVTGATTDADGFTKFSDGGYWVVGQQGFAGIYGTGGVEQTTTAVTTTAPETEAPTTTAPSTGGSSSSGSGAALGYSATFSSSGVTSAWDLANKCAYISRNYKTLYVMGCFGAPMTDSNKARYTTNHSYNKQASRTAMINAASSDTFGFDCVNLLKGVMWGWYGKLNSSYGGATYASNGVPDTSADGMKSIMVNAGTYTTNWSSIEIGEAVWMSGHIGIYIGNGLAVECTPKWDNDVQITAVGNLGTVSGYNTRTWTGHGKMPYVSYTGSNDAGSSGSDSGSSTGYTTYTVQSGDTLSGIAAKYGMSYITIANYNGISSPYTIYVGQVLKIPA